MNLHSKKIIIKTSPNIFLVFFSFLFFLVFSFAACYPEALQYLEPNLSYYCQNVVSEDQQAQILFIDSNPTLFFIQNSKEPLKEKTKIKTILDSSIIYDSNFSTSLIKVKNSISSFEAINTEPEKKCLQYLGLDTHSCTDAESCKVAAFSVPQTAIAVYAPGFLEAMLDYQQKLKDLNNSLNSFKSLLSSPTQSASYLKEVLNSMNDIEQKLLAYNSNSLLLDKTDEACLDQNKKKPCFEYCPKLSLPSDWQQTKVQVSVSATVLENISSTSDLAQKISDNSESWLEFLQKRHSMWDNLKKEINTLNSNLNSSFNSKKWIDKELLGKFNNSLNAFELINQRIKNGEFFVSINQAFELKKELQALKEQAESYNSKVSKLEQTKNNIALSLNSLKQADSPTFQSFNSKFEELKNQSIYPIESAKLDDLLNSASSLEKDILVEVAKIKLNIQEKDTNQTSDTSISQITKEKDVAKNLQLPAISSLCPFSFIIFSLFALVVFRKREFLKPPEAF